ncbi:unnamed protein product [Diamesa hyperborea]
MRRTTIHICGASIIAAQWTVTSAKCLVGVPAFQVSFRAGSSSRIAGGTIYQANLIVLHPDFKVDSFEFDVALVRISRQFQGPNIQIIALADESVSIRDRAKAQFAGWGVTNSGGFILPNILQAIEVPIIGAHECTCMMNTMTDVTDNMICAGAGVLDKCIGDFGGGLVIDNKLIGVASFSRNCGDSRFPGLYARVSTARNCSLHVVPYCGRENYLSVVNYLLGSPNGTNIELPAGKHKYKFSCPLASHLPSSIETKQGFIRYSLEVSIDVPLGFKKELKIPFTVIKQDDMNSLPSTLKMPFQIEAYKIFWSLKCKSKPLKFKVGIPYSGFVPGEALNLLVDVINNSNNDVQKFKISLLKVIKYTSQTPNVKTKIVKETVVKVCENGIKSRTSGRIKRGFIVPHIPSSNMTYCTVIEISYELKIVAKISGIHKSPKIKFPVIIGTIPIQAEQLPLKRITSSTATDTRIRTNSYENKIATNASLQRIPQQVAWDVPSMTSIAIEKIPDVI